MLGEASASFISTAELEMQRAPAVAAAAGGIVRVGIAAPSLCHDQRWVMVMTLAWAVFRSQHAFRS
jgi:hypothetical protein